MSKDALFYNGTPSPLYELNADEFAIPVYLKDRGRDFKLFFRLKALDFASYKKMLNGTSVAQVQQRGTSEAEIVRSGQDIVKEVAESHFLELAGVIDGAGKPLTEEKQRAFLNARPHVKELLGLAAAMPVSTPEIEKNGHGDFLVFEDEGDAEEIATEVTIADFKKKEELTVSVLHTLRAPSEADRIAYGKTTKTKTMTENKKESVWVTRNFDNVAKIYDSMVQNIDGAVIDGKHCEESNKAEWLGKVPLSWKAFVLTELFNRIESKNG